MYKNIDEEQKEFASGITDDTLKSASIEELKELMTTIPYSEHNRIKNIIDIKKVEANKSYRYVKYYSELLKLDISDNDKAKIDNLLKKYKRYASLPFDAETELEKMSCYDMLFDNNILEKRFEIECGEHLDCDVLSKTYSYKKIKETFEVDKDITFRGCAYEDDITYNSIEEFIESHCFRTSIKVIAEYDESFDKL